MKSTKTTRFPRNLIKIFMVLGRNCGFGNPPNACSFATESQLFTIVQKNVKSYVLISIKSMILLCLKK